MVRAGLVNCGYAQCNQTYCGRSLNFSRGKERVGHWEQMSSTAVRKRYEGYTRDANINDDGEGKPSIHERNELSEVIDANGNQSVTNSSDDGHRHTWGS